MTFFMPQVGGRALFIFPLHRAWSQLCGSLHEYAWNQIWHCSTPINNLVIWLELQKAPVHGLQNKRSLKTNKRKRASFQASLLFDWDRGFQHLGILLRVARGRVEGGKWAGLSLNGLACWQPGAVGVMVCEVTLYIGTVGSPSFFFFVKEAFAVEVWVSGLPVINHHSPFFSLTAQYKAWHLTPKTPDFCTDTSWGPKGGEEGKRKGLSWFL